MMFRVIAATVVGTMVVASVPAAARDEQRIRCESGPGGRYHFCAIETEGVARLDRELSSRRCVSWRSWGFDRHGVWAQDGCRGEFIVGRPHSSAGAVIAGAILGAAAAAAILGSRDQDQPTVQPIPSWLPGKYHGFGPLENRDFDVTIDAKGEITGTSDGDAVAGHVLPDRIHLGQVEFSFKQEDWGFSVAQLDRPDNVIYFRRQQ